MAYQITRNADPITANTNIYWSSNKNPNCLANSGTIQPYKSGCTETYLPIQRNTRRNFMWGTGSCGCVPAPTFTFMPSGINMQNRTLFTINGGGFSQVTGNVLLGGNLSGCQSGPVYDISNIGSYLNGWGVCGGQGYYDYLPMALGSGSTSGNGTACAWSAKGAASATPYGSTVVSSNPFGKSRSINAGIFSYASGDGGRALSIPGLFSKARSGGNTSYDISGLVNVASKALGSWLG